MEIATKQIPFKSKRRDKIESIYSRGLITRNIVLPLSTIGKNIAENIEQNIMYNLNTNGYS
jgi:hypothetical protein